MTLKWNLVLTLVVGMLFVQTSAMAVSLDPDATLQRPEPLADPEPTDEVPACLLVGPFLTSASCTTGQHTFTEGMTHELTGISASDVHAEVFSTMSGPNGTHTLRCDWAYAGGDTAPTCRSSGTLPKEGDEFVHSCFIGRATAGVVVCSIRPGPTV